MNMSERGRLCGIARNGTTLAQHRRDVEECRAYLAANGGKMLASDARKTMRLSESRFSELLATVPEIGKRPFHLNKKQNIIYLKSVFPSR